MSDQAPTSHFTGPITSLDALEALYGEPPARSLTKEVDRIIPPYAAFIEKAPFVVIASTGPEGLDCSPRGDPPGFVEVLDEKTLALPDQRGNNRLDTLKNIVQNPRLSLLFMIPGVGETLRINGTGLIVTDADLRARFAMDGKEPATVLIVTVGSIYYQCQKALVRSKLWDADTQIPRSALPSAGEINKHLDPDFDAEAYDAAYPERLKKTMY